MWIRCFRAAFDNCGRKPACRCAKWSALTDGDYRTAIELSQAAQQIAPRGSSVHIQATAQEGRAWARVRRSDETYGVLKRVGQLVAPLGRPDRPEHHYRYDPDKAVAYLATTLAWLGDPAAERYAREVIAKLKAAEDAGGWPRRVAAAQIDLGLALVAAGKPDEAAATAQTAILSGRIVPSNLSQRSRGQGLKLLYTVLGVRTPETVCGQVKVCSIPT